MPTITTSDGTQIFYKDWGSGQAVLFSHGWPLSADAWDAQMVFLGREGYRVIAHDRRGHGRSSQPWDGNDMDHYADDLAQHGAVAALHDAALPDAHDALKTCHGEGKTEDGLDLTDYSCCIKVTCKRR